MARFKLLASFHYERGADSGGRRHNLDDMVKFVKGDIIETDVDLVAKWPNKFERIIEAPPIHVSEARRAAVALLIENDPVWEESDRQVLHEMPEATFGKVFAKSGLTMPEEEAEEPEKPQHVKKAAPVKDKDVTGDFILASDNGLRVTCNEAGEHSVFKGKSKKPMNVEPLTAETVNQFITDELGLEQEVEEENE